MAQTEDSDNALLGGGIARSAPVYVNPLAAQQAGMSLAGQAYGLREKQAQEAWGGILQQSTDENGNVDYGKAQHMAAGNPMATMGMMSALKDTSSLRSSQFNLNQAQNNSVNAAATAALAEPDDEKMKQTVYQQMMRQVQMGLIPMDKAMAALHNMSTDPAEMRRQLETIRVQTLPEQQRQDWIYGKPFQHNVGGQIVGGVQSQRGGGLSTGPGAITTTASPEAVLSLPDIVYPATAQDVKDGRAAAVGAEVRMSGADRVTRFGLGNLLPPGAREVPGTGGARPAGGGVVGADGKPVGPNNQPRLLVVPGQGGAAAPPATPAPPGDATAPSPGAPGVGFGATLQATPAPSAPAVAPPPPPAPVVAPPTTTPAPAARPALPPNTPRAALEGGVPVASANALLPPTLGAAGLPSPLVPGDVNTIMAGMDRARAGGRSTGTQTAYNTISVGPGTEEAQGYKTSADKLAADDLAATNFQSTQFPYVQALKNYGQGTKTGPGTDFWNQVAGSIRTPLAKLGINVGPLADTTERVDTLGKWLAAIQSSNPVSAKSDAELAQVLKGSASTHINEVAGEDMVKAGLALQRMNVAANREWHGLSPQEQAQHGTYLSFLRDYNTKIDPRAFMVDMLNDKGDDNQKARLRAQLQNGSEADAARFNATLALARRNGLIGGAGSQAMP